MASPIVFAQPQWLLLLAALAPTWWWTRRSHAGLSAGRRRSALALRTLAIAALAVACARPQRRDEAKDVAVYFVIDASDSIPGAPSPARGDVRRYLEAAERTRPTGDARRGFAGLIHFGEEPAIEAYPRPAPVPTDRRALLSTTATDIQGAVRLAASTFPAATLKRIVLATDANQNRGDARAEIEQAFEAGVKVDVLPVRYRHLRELAVERLILPESIQEGVPFNVTAVLDAHVADAAGGDGDGAAIPVRIELRRGGFAAGTFPARLRPGRNVLALPTVARGGADDPLAGLVAYEITLRPDHPADDHLEDNNTAGAFARVHGPPLVLYVDGNLGFEPGYQPRLHAELARRLYRVGTPRTPGAAADPEVPDVRLRLVTLDDIPSEAELGGYDAIILDNVPAEALGPDRMYTIRSLVNDQGVGLAMIGGERAFGPGNYLNTPVEEALPVDMDIKQKRAKLNGALAIILHTCEFPNGNHWAKVITKEAIRKLGAQDYVGVLYFAWGGAEPNRWLFRLQPAIDRNKLMNLVDTCEPADMPDFDPTILMAARDLLKVDAAARHMIIISDGDPSPPSASTRAMLTGEQRITVTGVVIGGHATDNVLKPLALETGGRYYDVQDPANLPQIFINETMMVKRGLLVEDPFTPTLDPDADQDFVAVYRAARPPAPPLRGYVATTAKPGAEVPLLRVRREDAGVANATAADIRDPVLAHWRYGLGQAVAFTSDAKNRWAADWLGWPAFGEFWAEIVYKILREPAQGLRLETAVEGENIHLVVDALDPDGNPLPFLDLSAYATPPDGAARPPVRLRQTGVSRYEADVPAPAPGRYQLAVRTPPGARGPQAAVYGGVSIARSPEAAALAADEAQLEELARAGRGRLLSGDAAADDLFNPADLAPAADFVDLWRAFLFAAMVLLPLDVFTRRVMIDWTFVREWFGERWSSARAGAMRGRDLLEQELARARRRAMGLDDEPDAGAPAPRASTPRAADASKAAAPDAAAARADARDWLDQVAAPSGTPGDAAAGAKPGRPGRTSAFGAALAEQQKREAAGKADAEAKRKAEENGAFTNRLLQAKKRAQKDIDDRKDR